MILDIEEKFAERLTKLRVEKGVSARDMSLSIGQNAGYINGIESGKSFPSMSAFFYICEYLEITPRDFFDFGVQDPKKSSELQACLGQLNSEQLDHVTAIVKDIIKQKQT